MIHFEHYKSGAVFGIKYQFDEAGDGIPRHQHPPILAHNIVALRGSVRVDHCGGSVVLVAGEILDFDWSQPHEVVALKQAFVLHLFLKGQPAGYEALPSHELKGTVVPLINN